MYIWCLIIHLPEQQVEGQGCFFPGAREHHFPVPSGKMYVLLDDFNAHVGSRENVDEEWSSVRGRMDLDEQTTLGKSS